MIKKVANHLSQNEELLFERGGRLLYLGGNGLNCEVEFLDTGTMRCKTQLASLGGALGMADPSDPGRRFESASRRSGSATTRSPRSASTSRSG